MSQWIWKFGDCEIYHSLLVHNRRQEYGYPEPPVWKLYSPEPVVRFQKTVTTQGGTFRVKAQGDFSVRIFDGREKKKYWGQQEIPLEPGTVTVMIRVSNYGTFPSLYVDGILKSDETWTADDMTQDAQRVGCSPLFADPCRPPEQFPFVYEPVCYAEREIVGDGVLFSFEKETFARTRLSGLHRDTVRVQFGESREEALDAVYSVVHLTGKPRDGQLAYPPYAFRYLYVDDPNAELFAEYEYLPLAFRGSFHADEEIVNRVWDTAAYTFHLCSREFFLDGIKRDRWVWAADAYQSLFVNRYLFFDKEIEQRTLVALAGKSPFRQHINTIMDYTFFWIISLWEHYVTYGDRRFLEQMSRQMQQIMDFCRDRTDPDGFVRGKPGDWIFIDWAPMDKTGALCGEQILYGKALECYSRICAVLDLDDSGAMEQAEKLAETIQKRFYDEDQKAFIDSYESGKKTVSRQSNILAYLFLPCSREQRKAIYDHVILNEKIPQITTPYFKFYENQVHCEAGNPFLLERSLREYYGEMLRLGATTLYEAFDPAQAGAEHYQMYGCPYDKSLCHAWSASPIYLLGCYRLGVKNTGIAYDSFEVRPRLGDLKAFEGTVPVPGGSVRVCVNQKEIRIFSDIPGGTLFVGGEACPIPAKRELIVANPGITPQQKGITKP